MKINKKIFDNGLRLVHNEDTSTQMVALNIVYDVGARDEHPEHTGFAHLFEHLMFGGSVHIPDYDAPLQLAGGENNAWTNNDITNYYLTVPKSNVEIGFWLESDRMLELAFSEQSLEVQRAVVMEEFKQRCLNQPYGDVGHLLRPLAYQTHPYRWPTIGKDLSHIANATLDEVKEFFFRFYAPNNAVLAVTGNISWEETIRLTEKWFAPIPRRNVPVRQLPQEVVQTAERRQTVERNVPLDALFMAYHMCSREDADYYAFDILSDILSNGRSSRLTRRLVQEQKLFSSLDAYISGTRDAGLLHISGKPSAGVSLEQAEAAVRKELEELKKLNMTEAERLEAERKKEKEAVDKELADLKAALAESNKKALTSEITSMFANAGLSTETYASAIKAYASAPYEKPEDAMKEVETFVKGVSEANKTALDTAKAAWEKEALENTPNPGGGSGGKPTVKSDAAEFAKAYSAKMNQETKSVDGNAPVNI